MMPERQARRLTRIALFLGFAGTAGVLAGLFGSTPAVVRAWYFGAYTGLHLSLGCIALLFIGDLTGGRWVEQLEPFFNAGRRALLWTLPLFALSHFWLVEIFPWSANEAALENLFPLSKESYLSPPLFLARGALYAVIFTLLGFWASASARNIQARRNGEQPPSRTGSAGGLVLYAFTHLPFQTDAILSLAPDWFSTAFPLVMMASQVFAGYSLSLFCRTVMHAPDRPENPFFGNLLLAMMFFWLYVTFAQFLIIWMGNLTEDISYFLDRSGPLWKGLTLYLAVFSFVVPFLLLLHQRTKTRVRRLGGIALLLFTGQLVYLCWAVLPSWEPMKGIDVLLALSALIAVVGFWIHRLLATTNREVSSA